MSKKEDLQRQLEELESKLSKLYEKEDRSADESKEMLTLCDQIDAINSELDLIDRAGRSLSDIRKPQSEKPKQADPEDEGAGRFRSFGEYLQAVAAASMARGDHLAGMPTGVYDKRLSMGDRELRAPTGLAESTPSLGGFLVQQDYASELLQAAQAASVLYPKVRKLTLSTNANSVKIPGIDETSRASSRWGGIISYWESEAGSITASAPKFRAIELSLKKLTGLCYATDEMLADSSLLESVIRAGFEQEFSFKLDDAILRGTGSGQPLGILNAGALVSVTGASSADTIVAADVVACFARMYPGSMARAEWYANVDTIPELMLMNSAADNTGAPLWLPGGQVAGTPYMTLLGKRLNFIEQASTVGDVGDLNLLDLSQYIAIEKGGMQMASSMHVQFLTDEMVYRFIFRFDGQPAWHSALTPYKGSNTLSPFVTIGTRA